MVLPQPGTSTPLEELFVIEEGGEAPLFGSVGWQAFGGDGQIYVSDYQSMQVHEFTSDGTFVRSIGGPGEGPGEFQTPAMMQAYGDSLYVFDTRINRVSVFDQHSGAFLRSQKVEVEGWHASRLIAVAPNGLIMKYAPIQGSSADLENVADEEIRIIPLVADDASTAKVIWKTPGTEWIPFEVNGIKGNRAKPMGKLSECAYLNGTGYCAHSSAISVNMFSLMGDSLQSLRVPTEPRPVTPGERNDVLESIPSESVRNQMVVADTHPSFTGFIVVDDAGRIWFRRASGDGNTEYWILDPENQSTKSVTIEGNAAIFDIHEGRAVTWIIQEGGLRSVHVFATPSRDESSDNKG